VQIRNASSETIRKSSLVPRGVFEGINVTFVSGMAVPKKSKNELYLAVLPLVHLDTGLTEQTLTLFPDKSFATEFFKDEVELYINMFKSRAQKYLVGGHVVAYEFHQEPNGNGRVIVRVVQSVS
jgi:hypothetical protein